MNLTSKFHRPSTAAAIRARSGNSMAGRWCFFMAAALLTAVAGSRADEAAQVEWPYSRPVDSPPPQVKSADRVANPIDAFVLQKLEAAGLMLAPEADRRTLVRRLYFDLIGLPPVPEQVEAFVNNTDPKAYGELVDSLLADHRYGERWAKFWLDLARYADTAGYEGDPDLPHAWRYRDYVIDSFNRDKPYDEFIREQIAGDEFEEIMGAGELPLAKPEKVVALTFLRLAPFTEPRGDETRHEMLSEMTSTVSSVFLGLTVGCAKCHDHKYDKIPAKDFYRMQAFFNTVQIAPPERGDIFQIGGPMPADFYREGEKEWAENKRKELHGMQAQIDAMRADFGKRTGSAIPDEKQLPDAKQRAAKLDNWISDPATAAITAAEREQFLELKERSPFVKQHLKRLEPAAMTLRHSFGPPYEPGVPVTRVMLRGEYNKPGEPVEAGFLSCITGNQDPAKIRLDPFKRWPTRSRRMTLAQWIASPENPLTARVMVNRLWAHHFGRGIVPTLSDFGKLSGGPSHPELLDWLAHRFVGQKWSLKAMHRLMVTSSTYRQSSMTVSDRAALVDPDNTLLSRFNRRRVEAEAVRDAVLAVSGRLNPEIHGLPIFPPLPEDIAQRVKYDQSKWATDKGPEGRKRSVYIYQQRSLTMPFMQTFDGLVCEDTVPERRLSVTPLQALAMYNGDFVNGEVKHFAARVIKDAGDDPQRRIERAFAIAFGRAPQRKSRNLRTTLRAMRSSPGSAVFFLTPASLSMWTDPSLHPVFQTRRDFLHRAWNGIGALGLGGLLADDLRANDLLAEVPPVPGDPLQARLQVHARKAKHCIFLFMQGGVSQMDSFEYKPRLRDLHGKRMPDTGVSGELQGRLTFPHECVGSPFDFHQHGQSGRWMSSLFPNLARKADDLAFIHGIKVENQNHGPSTYHVTTGSQFPGHPSVGSWIQYGLGTANQNMPGYVVIQDPRGAPVNGAAVWANGYLPAAYQGALLRDKGVPILNLTRPHSLTEAEQRREFDKIKHLNELHLAARPGASELEARINAYELAFRMQTAAPEIVDISGEPESIQKLYGLDNNKTAGFGRQCLLARRLVERGVRYTMLINGVQIGGDSWDHHGKVKDGMIKKSAEVDLPVAGLLEDLKQRGLLEETLVVWASEMGRTPYVNGSAAGNPGREHNSYALCMWMAGGDVRGGATAGKTDDYSLRSVGEPIHVRDVHATILDLMGLNDEKLNYLHAGRIRRLTDIGGHVISEIIS